MGYLEVPSAMPVAMQVQETVQAVIIETLEGFHWYLCRTLKKQAKVQFLNDHVSLGTEFVPEK